MEDLLQQKGDDYDLVTLEDFDLAAIVSAVYKITDKCEVLIKTMPGYIPTTVSWLKSV